MEKKWNFALVGCGNIGQRHARLAKEFGNLTAVCDIDLKKTYDLGLSKEIRTYEVFEKMLNEIKKNTDIIIICTPNYLHAQQTIKALNAGYHVICEKPMALNGQDCQDMIEAADNNNKFLYVVKQNRFNPPVAYLKEILKKGILGKIYSISMNCFWNRENNYYENSTWRGRMSMDGGILFTQYSHFFDINCYLFGNSRCISAIGNNFAHKNVTEFDDTIVALMEFDSGILSSMHFTTNAYKKNMEGSLAIIGENGSVKIGGEYLNKLEYHEVKDLQKPEILTAENPNDYITYRGSMNNHSRMYEYFLNNIYSPKNLMFDLETSMSTVKTIESVYLKLNLHKSSN